MAEKLRQANSNKRGLNFFGYRCTSWGNNRQNLNILNNYHRRAVLNEEYRNKYNANRWIQDSRGCGWGNKTTSKRFKY